MSVNKLIDDYDVYFIFVQHTQSVFLLKSKKGQEAGVRDIIPENSDFTF